MTTVSREKNVLLVGDDYDVQKLVKSSLEFVLSGVHVSCCGTLRVGSPDGSLQDLSALILIWKSNPLLDWKTLLEKRPPTHRSSEGIICDISTHSGDQLLRRTAVIANGLSRDEVTFLAEFGVSCIQPLTARRSDWVQECRRFAQRVRRLIHIEDDDGGSPAERSVRRFERALKCWKIYSDQEKMVASDDLLRNLGDTARYCELMGRRAHLENDVVAAEKWLRRAIDKNPNYLSALNKLADLLKDQGQFAEALALYEKLRLSNPRHPIRLAKIAECHLALGRLENSNHLFSRARSIDEFTSPAREDLARVKLAMGDYEAAKLLLEHCGDVSRVASYLNAYGIQLVKAGRYQESIEHYKKAQMVLPTNTNRHQILFNIGLAYAKWGKFTEARQYAQLALAREPNYAKAAQLLRTMEERLP